LLIGATGTGKELVAPRHSPDQSSQPAKIGGMQLFGSGRYFAGEPSFFGHIARVVHRRHRYFGPGLFEFANNGNRVSLDEVGETSLPMQAKLLRVIQNREIQRVGLAGGTANQRPVDRGHQPGTWRAEVLAGRFPRRFILPVEFHSDSHPRR